MKIGLIAFSLFISGIIPTYSNESNQHILNNIYLQREIKQSKSFIQEFGFVGIKKEVTHFYYKINSDKSQSLIQGTTGIWTYDPVNLVYSYSQIDSQGVKIGDHLEYQYNEYGLKISDSFESENFSYIDLWSYDYENQKIIRDHYLNDIHLVREISTIDSEGLSRKSTYEYFSNHSNDKIVVSTSVVFDTKDRLVETRTDYNDNPPIINNTEYFDYPQRTIKVTKINAEPTEITIEEYDIDGKKLFEQYFTSDATYGYTGRKTSYVYENNLLVREISSTTSKYGIKDVISVYNYLVPAVIFNQNESYTIYSYSNNLLTLKKDSRNITSFFYENGSKVKEKTSDVHGRFEKEITYNMDGTEAEIIYYGYLIDGDNGIIGYGILEKFVYKYTY